MGRTAIPHLKPVLNTSKSKIEMQIEVKFHPLSEYSTVTTPKLVLKGERDCRSLPGPRFHDAAMWSLMSCACDVQYTKISETAPEVERAVSA